jgi:hypothetical protein
MEGLGKRRGEYALRELRRAFVIKSLYGPGSKVIDHKRHMEIQTN